MNPRTGAACAQPTSPMVPIPRDAKCRVGLQTRVAEVVVWKLSGAHDDFGDECIISTNVLKQQRFAERQIPGDFAKTREIRQPREDMPRQYGRQTFASKRQQRDLFATVVGVPGAPMSPHAALVILNLLDRLVVDAAQDDGRAQNCPEGFVIPQKQLAFVDFHDKQFQTVVGIHITPMRDNVQNHVRFKLVTRDGQDVALHFSCVVGKIPTNVRATEIRGLCEHVAYGKGASGNNIIPDP